jgi:hypothetical protein
MLGAGDIPMARTPAIRKARRADGGRSRSAPPRPAGRRLVITVCPKERGRAVLAVVRGGRRRRLDAAGVAECLRALVARRRLEGLVCVREACAGGCSRPGPNIDVTMHAVPPPGAKPDHVAIGWKTYVYSLASLHSVAAIIDENLHAPE